MKIVVGCPVRSRNWILPKWLFRVEMACAVAEVEPVYAFVIAGDDSGREIILDHCARNEREVHMVDSAELTKPYQRGWSPARYREMVLLRNWLLYKVRELDPEFFLSLDSDVLLHEDVLVNLFETAQSYDAVGGKCFMTFGHKDAPSYCQLINSAGMSRPDTRHVIPVDVIMAIKLMNRQAYAVDYCFDPSGEDVGWSRAVALARLTLGFDGRIVSKHVMTPSDLDVLDTRCGY